MTTTPARPGLDDVYTCPHCGRRHGIRWVCDQAAAILHAHAVASTQDDHPAVEFTDPISMPLGPVDLIAHLQAKAVIVPVAGVPFGGFSLHPTRAGDGKKLTGWLYVGDDSELAKFAELMTDIVAMARRAAKQATT